MTLAPLTCVGCSTTDFDPSDDAERSPGQVLSLHRFWLMAGDPPGPAYAVCNQCWDRKLGVLWNDDGTLARVWFEADASTT